MTRQLVKKPNVKQTAFDKGRLVVITVFCLIAIVQSGLRDISNLPRGNDTPNYYIIYQNVQYESWSKEISSISFTSDDYEGRDTGYSVFIKATQLVSRDFTFFMFLTAIWFMIPFGMFIYRFVKSYAGIVLVFLLFFALFGNIINSFMRQAISLGIVLHALRYVETRDWKKYFGLLLIAFTIHSSSIVAVPYYFLSVISKSKKWMVIALAISPILIYFSRLLFSALVVGTVYENYADSSFEKPVNFIALVFIISIGSLVCFNSIKKSNNYDILISGVIGSLLILPIVFLGNTMLRVSYYYVLSIIPLIPVMIDQSTWSKSEKNSIYALLISVFLLYVSSHSGLAMVF